MYLIRVKGRSTRIRILVPKGVSLDIPDDEKILELISQIRAGNEEAERQMFHGHLRLAIFIAGQYAMRVPTFTDDLAQEAMMALMMAIKDIPQKLKDDRFITSFLTQKVHGKLYTFLRKQLKKLIYDTTITEMGSILMKLKEYRKNRSRDMFQEIKDYLQDDREKEIIALRLAGYNDVEIAEKLGLTKMRISQIRHQIGKRINKSDLLRVRRN